MIDTRIVTNVRGTIELCETHSTEGFKLLQIETGIIYGSSVVDVLEGYKEQKPYSRFSYEETEEYDVSEMEDIPEPETDTF